MNWDELIFQTVAVFIRWPLGAFIPAAGFGLGFAWNRRIVTLIAALAWALYATLETLNYLRITCSGECNIRIDLLVIYPALWFLSIAGIIGLLIGRRRRAAA